MGCSLADGPHLLAAISPGTVTAAWQDTRLDPELAESARQVIEPEIRMLREKGITREQLEVPAGTSSQTQLLALFGFTG
jgi:hypothetical protein